MEKHDSLSWIKLGNISLIVNVSKRGEKGGVCVRVPESKSFSPLVFFLKWKTIILWAITPLSLLLTKFLYLTLLWQQIIYPRDADKSHFLAHQTILILHTFMFKILQITRQRRILKYLIWERAGRGGSRFRISSWGHFAPASCSQRKPVSVT